MLGWLKQLFFGNGGRYWWDCCKLPQTYKRGTRYKQRNLPSEITLMIVTRTLADGGREVWSHIPLYEWQANRDRLSPPHPSLVRSRAEKEVKVLCCLLVLCKSAVYCLIVASRGKVCWRLNLSLSRLEMLGKKLFQLVLKSQLPFPCILPCQNQFPWPILSLAFYRFICKLLLRLALCRVTD